MANKPDEFVLTTKEQETYFLDEKGVEDFLNEVGSYAPDYDEDNEDGERREWQVLDHIPVPKYKGSYCPFTYHNEEWKDIWPNNSVLIFRNGQLYVPDFKTITKTVESKQWVVPKRRVRSPKKRTAKAKK